MIGYLDVVQFDSSNYLGGLLVVDEFGLPIEFRHSLALRPTPLQRTLYGDALDRYLRAAVIAVRLLEDLESRPDVVLVTDAMLAIGGETPPVAQFERSGVAALGPRGTLRDLDGAQPGFLLQLRDGDPPWRFVTKGGDRASMAEAVAAAAETFDISEPPARVRAALALLAVDERAAAAA